MNPWQKLQFYVSLNPWNFTEPFKPWAENMFWASKKTRKNVVSDIEILLKLKMSAKRYIPGNLTYQIKKKNNND